MQNKFAKMSYRSFSAASTPNFADIRSYRDVILQQRRCRSMYEPRMLTGQHRDVNVADDDDDDDVSSSSCGDWYPHIVLYQSMTSLAPRCYDDVTQQCCGLRRQRRHSRLFTSSSRPWWANIDYHEQKL